VIVSEEQLKAFHLPSLKPLHYKYKLTAHEGQRIRRIAFARMQSVKGMRVRAHLCALRRRRAHRYVLFGDDERR
jgi:hypothetical protein